jgi:uncharacterized protein
MSRPRFHLAFPVRDLDEARRFYGGLLGCPEGRSSAQWVDFDFHGHQIVAHLCEQRGETGMSEVDAEQVPVRHFGLILSLPDWQGITAKLTAARVQFIIEPQISLPGAGGRAGHLLLPGPFGQRARAQGVRRRVDDLREIAAHAAGL